MKQVPPPPRSLILTDTSFPEYTLTVAHSNQGDPYRETLRITFEKGASGNYKNYEHLASLELEGDEEAKLRELLNERHARGLSRY